MNCPYCNRIKALSYLIRNLSTGNRKKVSFIPDPLLLLKPYLCQKRSRWHNLSLGNSMTPEKMEPKRLILVHQDLISYFQIPCLNSRYFFSEFCPFRYCF